LAQQFIAAEYSSAVRSILINFRKSTSGAIVIIDSKENVVLYIVYGYLPKEKSV